MVCFAKKVADAERGETHLFSVGQAGFIVKSRSGQLLGLDLYLSSRVERIEGHVGFKRLLPKLMEPNELEFDVLIASHPHWDHFDADAMPTLMELQKTRLFASVDCENLVRQLRIPRERTAYIAPGETRIVGDFTLHFVNCDHGTGAPDAVGVVIEIDGKRIYFAGDTCLRLDRTEEILQFGLIDVMLAPINGAFGNMNESECARLGAALRPGFIVPCHYGMFASHGGSPGVFYDIMRQQYPELPFLLMAMGEDHILGEETR